MPQASPSILFVNRVFPPDHGATGRRLSDLAERLAACGWRVAVVADGTGGEAEAASVGITLRRTGRAVPSAERPDARSYLHALLRLTGAALRARRTDVVVTMTDPPLLGRVGPLLAARHGAVSIHWSQDMFPTLLPVLGVRLPPPLLGFLERSMAGALARHDAVLAVGDCMAARLRAMGVPADRVGRLPNWADPRVHPVPHTENPARAALVGDGRFVVAYSGTLGLAHPMAGILDAADRLRARDPAIRFAIIGEGRGCAALAEAVRARGLSNVGLWPWQPDERLAGSLSAADLHLVTLHPAAAGLMVPSKLASAQAAGRPTLFLGPTDSEAGRAVAAARCGAVLDPQDGAALADAITAYAADPARCAREGMAAQRAAATWRADDAAARFDRLARELLARQTRGRPTGVWSGLVGWRVSVGRGSGRVPDA